MTRVPGLEIDRVAEILINLGTDGRGRRGAGYRATSAIVLTGAHVVHGALSARVRFEADQPGVLSADETGVLEVPEIDRAANRYAS